MEIKQLLCHLPTSQDAGSQPLYPWQTFTFPRSIVQGVILAPRQHTHLLPHPGSSSLARGIWSEGGYGFPPQPPVFLGEGEKGLPSTQCGKIMKLREACFPRIHAVSAVNPQQLYAGSRATGQPAWSPRRHASSGFMLSPLLTLGTPLGSWLLAMPLLPRFSSGKSHLCRSKRALSLKLGLLWIVLTKTLPNIPQI